MPEGWRWFYHSNLIPKAIIAIIMPQFECGRPDPYSITSGCPTIMDPTSGAEPTVHAFVQRSWDTSYDNVFGRMIGWLVLTYFVFRLGIWAPFKYNNHLHRSTAARPKTRARDADGRHAPLCCLACARHSRCTNSRALS